MYGDERINRKLLHRENTERKYRKTARGHLSTHGTKAREKGIPHTDVCIVISRQVQSGNYFDFGANCKWGWGDGI